MNVTKTWQEQGRHGISPCAAARARDTETSPTARRPTARPARTCGYPDGGQRANFSIEAGSAITPVTFDSHGALPSEVREKVSFSSIGVEAPPEEPRAY